MVTVAGQSPSPGAPVGLPVLERITYVSEDTGYTIARVATGRAGADLLTVTGPLLGAQVGESLRLTGRWSSHPPVRQAGPGALLSTVLPATIRGIRAAVPRSKR
jgi:exodeoxyribonuclease V alpha subunit